MKKIYILLTKSDTTISKIINLATDDLYTHASISFEKELQPMYSFARKYVNSPLPAGLRTESLSKGFFEKHCRIPCALYELEVADEVYEKAKQEVAMMMREAPKYQFSVMGLILCKLGIPYHRKTRLFCSEFVSEILKRSNALYLPKDTSLMRPGDYTSLKDLSCIYQGRLHEMLRQRQMIY